MAKNMMNILILWASGSPSGGCLVECLSPEPLRHVRGGHTRALDVGQVVHRLLDDVALENRTCQTKGTHLGDRQSGMLIADGNVDGAGGPVVLLQGDPTIAGVRRRTTNV